MCLQEVHCALHIKGTNSIHIGHKKQFAVLTSIAILPSLDLPSILSIKNKNKNTFFWLNFFR